MTWVKVCGMTRAEDIEAAEAAGADAIGLVLVPESPRAVTVDQAAELAAGVTTQAVLVTKDLLPEDLVAAALVVGVEAVQLYGAHAAEAADMAAEVGLFVLRPVEVDFDLSTIPESHVPLFDNRSGPLEGGSGQSFDHRLLPRLDRRFVLAGGLGPDNVREAIRATGAWGVDASSRLEARPGVKDHGLVARFVREAKQA
jgi:phosphoribosylanthranilate isomerase